MDYLHIAERAFDSQIESVLEGERAVVARINTDGIDRLQTVIDPLGADVTHFNKTRSVLWNHGTDPIRGTLPIGQGWVKVRNAERDMIGKTVFGKGKFCDDLFEQCKTGECRGWSIKAGVLEASPPTKEEIRARPELKDCLTIYRKWDLIEFSATPTPGNSDCVTMLVSRGLMTAPEGFVPSEAKPEPIEELSRYITHSGDKWIVHAEDGKVLGEHPSKEGAEKQLAAVEAHKHDGKRWIDPDNGSFHVTEPSGHRIVAFRSMDDAQDCLAAMAAPGSFERILMAIHTEQRAAFEQRKEDLLAEIMLRQWGVV